MNLFLMKKNLLIILLLFTISFHAQTERIIIPGTKLSIIPPKGFVLSNNFSGLQNTEKGASIMVSDLLTSYTAISDAMNENALKTQGMILIKKEIVNFNQAKATLIYASQEANGMAYNKQILIFGNGNQSFMVNGIYPEKFKNLESEIKTSLLSSLYDKDQEENSLETVNFTVDVSNSTYKFVKYMSGTLLYSEDGKFPSDKGFFLVGNSVGKFQTQNLKQYSIDRLKKLPYGEKSKVISVNEIAIDNLNGYEITASNDRDEIVYQVMLYTKSEYYIIVGQAGENKNENLKTFKILAKTFRKK